MRISQHVVAIKKNVKQLIYQETKFARNMRNDG